VFVYNIGQDADENTLLQLFGRFGTIVSTKVVRDPATQKCKVRDFLLLLLSRPASRRLIRLERASAS
jgi:ELAV like protein 2/3/4